MSAMQEVDIRKATPPSEIRPGRRRKRRRKKSVKRRLSIPAPLVFYATATLAALSTAVVYLWGDRFLGFSLGACLLIIITLLVNERAGFSRSRQVRRSHEARDKFTILEVAVLFVLLLGCIFISVLVWVT